MLLVLVSLIVNNFGVSGFVFLLSFQKKISHIIEFIQKCLDQLIDFYIGVQLKQPGEENKVRVNSDATLHITNVMVDFGYSKHLG